MKLFHSFSVLLLILILWITGCQPSQKLVTDAPVDSDIEYRLTYIIHGDGNYLYHDEEGNGLQADEEKVAEAIQVGLRAKKGEVFIFHQKPERKILWLFPRKDRVFLHYRNGHLINYVKYSPQSSQRTLVAESDFYRSHKSKQEVREYLLYFGHEIPQLSGQSYHSSRKDVPFNGNIFADGLRSFLDDGRKFDLTVLSTCDNGTPRMVSLMQPLSRYLLASPQNLHLSHIDTESLLELEHAPEIPIDLLARRLAKETYNRLTNFIETAVTLSIYDLQSVNFGEDLISPTIADSINERSERFIEQQNTDCAQLPLWDSNFSAKGTTVFFKPAAFGRQANQQVHSGWGCRR